MYLKRLELLGFKSFPEKTVVKLTPGVTAVVGPNGCGKSNIFDAIRWVLGEQRVSLLRGSKMEEIIFNGTRDMKPLGMAEITLVIQNNKGILPTEYGEVQITRRLFRSGESEYLLNKIPCRLKDITELLMDTGIGSHIYSMIQMDMIDAILSDRTDDRHFLFEEAAGISKYKSRKKAALRKLESTEQDLLRLQDIVSEVTTQVNSLRRQMKKAERYQELSTELRGWELYINRAAIDSLKNEQLGLQMRRNRLLDTRTKYDTEIDKLSSVQEEDRSRLIELDRRLTEVGNGIYEKSEAGHRIETEISLMQEKKENSKRLLEKNRLDLEAFAKRKGLLEEQIGELDEELRKLETLLENSGNEIDESEKSLAEVDEKVLAARKEHERLNRRLLELEGLLSAGKSDDTNMKAQDTELTSRLSEYTSAIESLNSRRADILNRQSVLAGNVKRLEESYNAYIGKKSELDAQIATCNAHIEDISDRSYNTSASVEAAEARRQLLSEMITHYEGYSGGAISVLEDTDRWPGIIGTVADNFQPREGFEKAIEAALGEIAGFIICNDRNTAHEAIEFLRRENKGKAGFIILDTAPGDGAVSRPDLSSDGFLGWADTFVDTENRLQSLTSLLLSRVAVATPENAASLAEQLPSYFAVVDTDGRLYRSRAVVSGGSTEGISLFGRKEKVEQQLHEIDRLKSELEELKKEKNQLTARLGSLQSERSEAVEQLESLTEELATANSQKAATEFEFQGCVNDIGRIENERRLAAEKLEALKTRQYSLNLNHDQLAREKTELIARLEQQQAIIADLEQRSEKAAEEVSRRQIGQVELKSKKEQLESQIRHIRELIYEIDRNTTIKSDENAAADFEINHSGENLVILEKQLKEIFDERSRLSESQMQLRGTHAELQEVLTAREKEIKAGRIQREESLRELHDLELRLTEIDSEMRNIIQKIAEEYDLDITAVEIALPNDTVPPEERRSHMLDLKEKMKAMGAVNLLALDEFRTAQERQEFLSGQIDDLLNAKNTLQSTITKINTTAKRLFLETFAQVRENFQKVFEELFTGGQSDIRLVNEEDPLESAIEIIARPRGKKLLSITQMSGGERALTAISLLFAIYLVKPSPFCILDEIDAPLDDANIHRFLKLIKTFSDQTQFIIITHNKITMEASDNMYGITMEQPGISKVVSVRFQEEPQNGDLIDMSMAHSEYQEDVDIPEPIRRRMESRINIDEASKVESE